MADLVGVVRRGAAGLDRLGETEEEKVHLEADLVGDADECGVRERAEVEVAEQRAAVVAGRRRDASIGSSVERRRPAGHGLQALGDDATSRVGLVDDHRPRAVRRAGSAGEVRGGRWTGRTCARGLVATAVASKVGSSMSWHIERT